MPDYVLFHHYPPADVPEVEELQLRGPELGPGDRVVELVADSEDRAARLFRVQRRNYPPSPPGPAYGDTRSLAEMPPGTAAAGPHTGDLPEGLRTDSRSRISITYGPVTYDGVVYDEAGREAGAFVKGS